MAGAARSDVEDAIAAYDAEVVSAQQWSFDIDERAIEQRDQLRNRSGHVTSVGRASALARHSAGQPKLKVMRFFSPLLATKRIPWLQVAKTFIAIALSWVVSMFALQVDMPIFAAIAALLIVAPNLNQTASKGIERTLGVIAGVIIATVFGGIFGHNAIAAIAAIAVALLIGWAGRLSLGMLNQMAISGMIVIVMGGGSVEFALDRIIETIIGAIIGFLVNMLIVAPVHVEPARQRVADLGAELAASLGRLADALEVPQSPGDLQGLILEARLLRNMVEVSRKAIEEARESLALNPRGRRNREQLDEMDALLETKLQSIVTEVIGMTRAFYDHYDDSLPEEPMAHDIAEQLRRCAHDVRLAVHLAEVDPEPLTSAIPALTAPLELSAPRGQRWILIGSLMEDLRRIRETLLTDGDDD